MRDEHRHCPCNGAWLCSTCHKWAHAHPFEARGHGFIVSRHVATPGTQAVVAHYGAVRLDCEGNFEAHDEEEE